MIGGSQGSRHWPFSGLWLSPEPSAALFVVHTGDPVVPSSGICLLGGDQIMLLEADISWYLTACPDVNLVSILRWLPSLRHIHISLLFSGQGFCSHAWKMRVTPRCLRGCRCSCRVMYSFGCWKSALKWRWSQSQRLSCLALSWCISGRV